MSSPAAFGQWQGHGQGMQTPPPPPPVNNGSNEDGITVMPMKLKVLYTFDDQNKTNCLARWPHILQVQTIMMEEGGMIGVIELKTCIQAIVQCSPELVNRMGQDYTVYAYDFSEYDNPLVGQGMLSRVLQATSPTPDVPAQDSRQLVTGRVCKNITAIFSNGLKETLEVKLRLVPVPTLVQNEYQNTMEQYRETNRSVPPPGYDPKEWNSLIQSAPNFAQAPGRTPLPPNSQHHQNQHQQPHPHQHPNPHQHVNHPQHVNHHQHANHHYHSNSHQDTNPHSRPNSSHNPNHNKNPHQRDGASMEPVNQLPDPRVQEQAHMNSFSQQQPQQIQALPPPVAQSAPPALTKGGKVKKTVSRPASRAATKRPRKSKVATTPAVGGNTSGYEEGTDGDDGPAPKKRAKTTKATEWSQNNSFGTGSESLRVAASTAGSLRLFRPIAMSPAGQPGSHLQEIPRAPTPIPRLPQNNLHQQPAQSGLRRDSFSQESANPPSRVASPYAQNSQQDELRVSIESAGPSPGRQDSPADSPAETPHEFNSSPPVMRTRPPSMRSSPPCPTSPCLPPMPRTDSGFMSGSLEELFGDDDQGLYLIDDDDVAEIISAPQKVPSRQPSIARTEPVQIFRAEYPGPVEFLPTRMPIIEPPKSAKPKTVKSKAKAPRSRGGSVMSEDGTQSLPTLKSGKQTLPTGQSMLKPQDIRGMSPAPSHNAPSAQQPMSRSSPVLPHANLSKTPYMPPNVTTPSPYPPHQMNSPYFSASQQQGFHQQQPSDQPHFSHPQSQQIYHQQPPSAQSPFLHPQNEAEQPQLPQLPPQQQSTSQEKEIQQPQEPQLPAQQPNIEQGQADVSASIPPNDLRQPSLPAGPAPRPEPRQMMVRTASLGSLNLPQIPASDPVLPPSSLQRSQTWSEAPHAMTEGPMPMMHHPQQMGPQPMGPYQMGQGPPPPPTDASGVPFSRTWNAKKASIRMRLEQAIMNGEMPPFCHNCGAIETPTWRKSWCREFIGAPGYFEYSDEPGRVTSIVILTRDVTGHPMSFLMIKKSLKEGEDNLADFKEFVLCNPCGIWMSKYKTQRPPERWDGSAPIVKKIPEKRPPKPRPSRPRKTAAGSEPPVAFDNPPATDGPSPTDTMAVEQSDQPQERQRSTSARPTKRLNAMTSDAASVALRRAIQSSPARWQGTRHSPIELEDVEPARRVLFPSPRKDGLPMVLGETITNIVQLPESYEKDQLEAPNKENCPPIIFDADEDGDFLRLFEEEMARPSTPVQKELPENPFKTPVRPTPGRRGINPSASKSGGKSGGNVVPTTPTRTPRTPGFFLQVTPTRTPRRSPRNHNPETPRRSPRNHVVPGFESPFTKTMNQMMSEAADHAQANSSPSRMHIDFENLPNLPLGTNANNFSLEDFFSTDVPMPSSPPDRPFRLYEDPHPLSLNNINWDEFNSFNEDDFGAVMVKEEPKDGGLEKGLGHGTGPSGQEKSA